MASIINGTANNDTLTASASNDTLTLNGLDGHDQLWAENSWRMPVVLNGGAGDDTLYASSDNSIENGGPGNDVLAGGDDRPIQFGRGSGQGAIWGWLISPSTLNAMAAFTPPAIGQTTLTPQLQAQLGGVLASSWA